MSQDPPVPRQGSPADDATVLEWGPPEGARSPRTLSGLHRHPRLPVVLVGLGGVAALASLTGEWLVMALPRSSPDSEPLRVPGGVSEVGGFGIAYLVGLLGLAGTAALVLGGSAPARRDARVLGTGLAVALLALLVAATVSLDEAARRSLFYTAESGFRVEYGRGLVMAFVAVALLGAALRLSGVDRSPALPADTSDHGKRPRHGRDADDGPAAPEGLTVEPASPFARPEATPNSPFARPVTEPGPFARPETDPDRR